MRPTLWLIMSTTTVASFEPCSELKIMHAPKRTAARPATWTLASDPLLAVRSTKKGRCAGGSKNEETAKGQSTSHVTRSRNKTGWSHMEPGDSLIEEVLGTAAARYLIQRGIKSSGGDNEDDGISSGIFNTCFRTKVGNSEAHHRRLCCYKPRLHN